MQNLKITNITIRQDAEGRYCLNDLHKAAGGEPKDQPRHWIANQQTQDLIKELTTSGNPLLGDGGIPLSVIKGGTEQGTFAVKPLVYAYAMWISAKFHLEVIRAYDAMVTATYTPPSFEPAKTRHGLAADMLDNELHAAASLGCPLHLAQVEAVKAVRSEHGVDYSRYLVIAPAQNNIPKQDVMREPTEAARALGFKSAQAFNQYVCELGLQLETPDGWIATPAGQAVSHKHAWAKGSKTGYNLKWNVEKIRDLII